MVTELKIRTLLPLSALFILTCMATGQGVTDPNQEASQVARKQKVSLKTVNRLNRELRMSFKVIDGLSKANLRKAIEKLNEGEDIDKRAEYERSILTGKKDGRITDQYATALKSQELTRGIFESKYVAGIPTGRLGELPPSEKGLDPKLWVSMGPNNVSGRTRCVVIDSVDPNSIWVGSVSGGVWHTADGGATFAPVDDLMANLSVSCLAQHPKNRKILIAGTGEYFNNGDWSRGSGLIVTTDGAKWEPLEAPNASSAQFITGLAFDRLGKTLLVADGVSGTKGIYRCTAKDSKELTAEDLTTLEPVFEGDASGIRTNPKDSRKAVAGSLSSGKSYFSEDNGKTWSESTHRVPWIRTGQERVRVEVTYASADPNIVYASVNMSVDKDGKIDADDSNNSYHGVIFKSTDGGKSFEQCRTANSDHVSSDYLGQQGGYDNCVWANDPIDPNLLIVGGVDLWRSTDGGQSMTTITQWYNESSIHADHHCIVSDPRYDGSSNRMVYFGNDGGLALAKDARTVGSDDSRQEGWTKFNRGLVTTQFNSAVSSDALKVFVGGLQDNGTLSLSLDQESTDWTEIFGGDGGRCQIDEVGRYLYGEYVFGMLHRFKIGESHSNYVCGQYWDEKKGEWSWKKAPYVISEAQEEVGNFIAPFELDSNDTARMFVGLASLWVSENVSAADKDGDPKSGPKWKTIKPILRGEELIDPSEPWYGFISTVNAVPGHKGEVWVGYNGGMIFKTENAGIKAPDWTIKSVKGVTPNRVCTQIVADPRHEKIVYATFGGFDENNVWRSIDGGTTWDPITKGIVASPVHCLAINPDNSDFLYLGTEVGIYASDDGGLSWAATNQGPANCSVKSLTFSGKKLIAATYGRGVFSIDLSPAFPKK